jgi:hypothetical protein
MIQNNLGQVRYQRELIFDILAKVLAEGKGGIVRDRLKLVFAKATPGLREAKHTPVPP